ncbi:MAG: hypothetical protein WAW85_06860 [Gordonia sp. (in: high G+C Gram-positive bacteria)]|uniref:hypothetical protein n=1 Tax=Gordonia sp. (in: high G+C Gram-positive bacteria) TaxID=84139 RepID=UPI003BB76EB4
MIGKAVALVCGLILLVAAVAAWWVSPVLTAVLVAVSVVIMTGWQVYRRAQGIPAAAPNAWTVYIWPLSFGALAVIALNGWIYRISADAGGESGEVGTLIGLATGVVGMAAAYGYGRVRAQKVQVSEQQYGGIPDGQARGDDVDDDADWFFPTAR